MPRPGAGTPPPRAPRRGARSVALLQVDQDEHGALASSRAGCRMRPPSPTRSGAAIRSLHPRERLARSTAVRRRRSLSRSRSPRPVLLVSVVVGPGLVARRVATVFPARSDAAARRLAPLDPFAGRWTLDRLASRRTAACRPHRPARQRTHPPLGRPPRAPPRSRPRARRRAPAPAGDPGRMAAPAAVGPPEAAGAPRPRPASGSTGAGPARPGAARAAGGRRTSLASPAGGDGRASSPTRPGCALDPRAARPRQHRPRGPGAQPGGRAPRRLGWPPPASTRTGASPGGGHPCCGSRGRVDVRAK